jgi:hypothetical protein
LCSEAANLQPDELFSEEDIGRVQVYVEQLKEESVTCFEHALFWRRMDEVNMKVYTREISISLDPSTSLKELGHVKTARGLETDRSFSKREAAFFHNMFAPKKMSEDLPPPEPPEEQSVEDSLQDSKEERKTRHHKISLSTIVSQSSPMATKASKGRFFTSSKISETPGKSGKSKKSKFLGITQLIRSIRHKPEEARISETMPKKSISDKTIAAIHMRTIRRPKVSKDTDESWDVIEVEGLGSRRASIASRRRTLSTQTFNQDPAVGPEIPFVRFDLNSENFPIFLEGIIKTKHECLTYLQRLEEVMKINDRIAGDDTILSDSQDHVDEA